MNKRIAIFGKNSIAVRALEVLYNKNVDIVLVTPNNSESENDGWQRSLIKYAKEKNLPIKQFSKVKENSSIKLLKNLRLDFIFSAQYDQILNQEVIDTAKYGVVNLHFSPLPRYRGVSPVALALLNHETEFGVTMHYIDLGVDTGDIISQKFFNIAALNSARELYDLIVIKGGELFEESIDDILLLKNSRVPQDNSKALYFPKASIDFTANKINFNKDSNSLTSWIKAFLFPPFQYPVFIQDDKTYEVVSVNPDFKKNKFEKPGTVVRRDGKIFKFSTQDSYIDLTIK
jgi:methionyl-tRNA formyltransferase